MGAPPDVVQAANVSKKRAVCEVLEENWETLQVFLCLSSQWRIVVGMGNAVYHGIEFESIQPCFWALGVKKSKRRQMFLNVVMMAEEAAAVLNKKQGN